MAGTIAVVRRRVVTPLSLGLACLALGACASAERSQPAEVALTVPPATVAAPPTSEPAPPVPPPVPAPPAPDPEPVDGPAMPDVVCVDLQDAQDRIQRAGVLFSRSRDATGRGRAQLWDRSWVVVAQQPAPGSPLREGEAMLDVVKDAEVGDRCDEPAVEAPVAR